MSKGGGLRKLEDQAEFSTWGTPTTRDHKDGSSADADVPTNGLLGRQVIREDVLEWQTPATDSFRSRGGQRRNEMGLDQQSRLLFPDPQSETNGAESLPTSLNSNPLGVGSIGSAMDSEALVYCRWSMAALSRQGRLKSSGIGSAAEESDEESAEELDESDEAPAPRNSVRELKQRKLWAYRQRTMGWSNPMTWTRPAFRRKLNARFVESLMMWPSRWTSDQAVLGPAAMELWRSRALAHLQFLLGGRD